MNITIPPLADEAAKVPVASQESSPPNASAPEPVRPESEPDPKGSEQPEQAAPEQGEEEKPKKRPISHRISELVAERNQSRADVVARDREIQQLRQELGAIQQRLQDPSIPFEEQQALQMRAVLKAERAEEAEANARAASDAALQKTLETFEERSREFAERTEDFFDVVLQPHLPFRPQVMELLADSDNGPAVAYHLAKNPRDFQKIASLPPHLMGAAIARIEAKIATPVRKVSNAPPPPPRVSGAVSATAKDPATMSDAEYSAWYRSRQKRA